ncbi:MAG: aminotransferase class I/II-fold pyridoxal phosphate-dependent enzyme [Oscillospiraceae bacterium]|jgi:histidinol-phosphate aminotransferase|nr:aminotransferase class I/II-fold pyridoxal phosphate-dependent enzyme [Oscillospiraceae bacterium]
MSYTLCKKLQNLKPYEPISGEYEIRLDANESFMNLPEDILFTFSEKLKKCQLNRYPDPMAKELCELYGEFINMPAEMITAGNGSDELLMLIASAFLQKGDKAMMLTPDFSMYKFYAEIAEAEMVECPKNDDLTIDADKVIEKAREENVRLLTFSNPCNPTSLGISAYDVLRIARGVGDCLLVVDEAYMDFWDDESVIVYLEHFDNIIVLRTCSKAFKMAGLRCGFAVTNKKLSGVLKAVKSPYNLNSMTQMLVSEVLRDRFAIREAVAINKAECAYLHSKLVELSEISGVPMTIYETKTNFVFMKLGEEKALEVFKALKQRGIIIRHMGEYLRITAGSRGENQMLIIQLRQIFNC